jgi:hypothetical protein
MQNKKTGDYPYNLRHLELKTELIMFRLDEGYGVMTGGLVIFTFLTLTPTPQLT